MAKTATNKTAAQVRKISVRLFQMPARVRNERFCTFFELPADVRMQEVYDLFKMVYVGRFKANSGQKDTEVLEFLFSIFNTGRPVNYTGRSMSVSDVVALGEVNEDGDVINERFYTCDSVGFRKIEG